MDQFRGYAILTMIFVNSVGRFDLTPWMLKHHRVGMSFNDTVAPIFIFVVGMGFRLSLLRTVSKAGLAAARRAALRRYAILFGIGFAAYFGYFWDALTDIGAAGFLALPFMDKKPATRIAAAAVYLAIYQCAYSWLGYGEWVMAHSINGGPLGPLSWAFMLLMGTVAYDILALQDPRRVLTRFAVWGVALVALGWAIRAPWPGLKPIWHFSQYGMSAPYPLYATGLCFLTLLAFYVLCDLGGRRLPHLTILGENPLVLYAAQAILVPASEWMWPNQGRMPQIAVGLLCVYGLCYGLAWTLHRNRIIVKV